MSLKEGPLADGLDKVAGVQQTVPASAPIMATKTNTITEAAVSPTTTTSKYVREFESLFSPPIQVEQLRIRAQDGNLRHCQYRSLCWRYFLRCLPEQYNNWLGHCKTSRLRYEEICAKNSLTKKPSSVNKLAASSVGTDQKKSVDGEISNRSEKELISQSGNLSSGCIDKQYQDVTKKEDKQQQEECDHKSVFKTIERDVVRTFPDMEFFKQSEIQAILENVLFNFARENPHISYKQGMHELLATLLYVAHTDSHNCDINYKGDLANDTIATLLDLNYLEHDVFHLFSALMKSIEAWYQNDEILAVPDSPRSTKSNRMGPGDNNGIVNKSSSSKQQVNSVLSLKLKKISENIVRHFDKELFNHLEALQIAPQIYGIRWMRLLFGREFEFLDLLMVWDAIICDQAPMALLDYVFASMLITIREKLVHGDYTDCLNNLMRHQFKDVSSVIKLALHLRDPINNPRPKLFNQIGLTTKNKFRTTNNPGSNQYQHPYNQRHNSQQATSTPTSLTSKLGQQYLSRKQYLKQQISSNNRQQNYNNVPQNKNDPLILSAACVVKEYEMREMQSASSSSAASSRDRGTAANSNRFPMGKISSSISSSSVAATQNSSQRNVLNSSAESYDDLHSIVDYCWRLLSEQIDSLQKCLPKEKSLTSEDEIFVALAQLKKVRDVLKGSLRLEDELESSTSLATASGSKY